MSTFADGKSSPQILDYIQSAPKGTSKKLIEEIYHKHNGDHAKIHEAISGMWNRRESNSQQNSSTAANNSNGNSNASKDGEWESVQKRKKRERKPYDNSGVNGDSRRGGRGGRGRGRGGPPRGPMNPHHSNSHHKKHMDGGRGSSVGGTRRGGMHRTNPAAAAPVSASAGFDMSPAVPPVKTEVQRVQPVAKPAVSGSTANPWSKGPPDFARMLRGEEEAKKAKEQQHKQAEANAAAANAQATEKSKDDAAPGQAFDNAAPAGERRNRGRVNKEVPKPVVEEKPKVPSWADRLTKPPQPPKPPTPVAAPVAPAPAPVEAKPKEEVTKPVEAESTPPAVTESAPPVSKPKAPAPQAPLSKPAPIAKPPAAAKLPKPVAASTNIVPEKKQEGKAVKLPANFGVGGNSSFNVAFGATSFDSKPKKAAPSQWGQGSRQKPMSIQKKPQSKAMDESKGKQISSKSKSIKGGNKPISKQAVPKDLETSQKQFMSDLMTGNASAPVEEKKNVVLHGEGGAVSAAELESKMLAAQKDSAKEEQMMKQQVPQVSLMTNKQHSGNTGGDRYNKANNRNKNPRGMRSNMEKPYNMARNVGPGLPTSQDAETQQGNAMGYNTMQYQQSSEGYNQPRQQESYASNYGYNSDPFYNTSNQTQQHSLEAGAPPPGMSDGSHQVAGQRQHKDQQQPMGHHQPPPPQQHNQMHHHHQQQQQQQAPPQPNNMPQQQQQQQPQQHQQQQQSNQPGGFGGSQFGQQYNAPPGMNPLPYQNNIPPYYPANNYYYGYPQYGAGSQYPGGQHHQSQFPGHNMYEGGVPSSFGGHYEQPNMYQGYDSMNQFSGNQPNIGGMTLNDNARQGASSSQGMNVGRGAGPSNISGKKSGTEPQQQGGPPGYSQQPQQPYATYGNQHFQQPGQPGNYFIQQPPMQFGHQQQQFPPQQQQPQPQQPQQQPPQQPQPPQQQQLHRGSQSHQMQHQQQTSHGGWNSNNR